MRFIDSLEPITVYGVSVTMQLLVTHLLDNEPVFIGSAPGFRAAIRIERAMAACAADATFLLEESDWALLAGCVEAPVSGYPTLTETEAGTGKIIRKITIGRHLLPFIDCIVAAKEQT